MSDAEREARNESLDVPALPRESVVLLGEAAKSIDARPVHVAGSKAPSRRMVALRTKSARERLGKAGLVVTMLFVVVAVFADFLASDFPIACKIQDHVFLFPNVRHPAALTTMSPEVRARDTRWSVEPLVRHGATSVDPLPEHVLARPLAVKGHPLGTDVAGRDVFARIVHGTRGYLIFAFAAVFVSLVLGGFIGAVAGAFGGTVDAFAARLIETVSAFPSLVLVLGIQAAVPHATLATVFFAIALTRWPEVARLVRAEVIRITTRDYVMAARALGASPFRVLRRHVMPHVRSQVVVLGAFGIPAVILVEASLDFLRVGPSRMGGIATTSEWSRVMSFFDPTASWGETMSEFRDAPHAWWLLAFPGVMLFVFVVALNIAAEARRDALDPRAR